MCTRLAPVADRSAGATPVARCGSGRGRRAPAPGPPAAGAAAGGSCASGGGRDSTGTGLLSGEELTAKRIAAEVAGRRDEIGEGIEDAEPRVSYEMRYRGQAFELPIAGPVDADPAELAERFAQAHEGRYGYRDPDGTVELVNIHLALAVPGPEPRPAAAAGALREIERRAHFG